MCLKRVSEKGIHHWTDTSIISALRWTGRTLLGGMSIWYCVLLDDAARSSLRGCGIRADA